MTQAHKEMLEKQLQLLSERSVNTQDYHELVICTGAMVEVLRCLAYDPAWTDKPQE